MIREKSLAQLAQGGRSPELKAVWRIDFDLGRKEVPHAN